MASNQKRKTKIKPGEKVDRISSLPDPIIQHILSFLPSTSTAAETCVLSKRWRYQWTRVPVLIFGNSIPDEHFLTHVSSALFLHDSPTITKFVIDIHELADEFDDQLRSLLPGWIRFAMQKQVKELTLDFGYTKKHPIPQLFFNNVSLVKCEASGLDFSSCGQVNWPSLKVLSVEFCDGVDKAIGKIVSGSPLLESLQFMCINWNVRAVIASASLKRLVVKEAIESDDRGAALKIACPNLEELELSNTFLFESCTLLDLPSSAHVTLDLHDFHTVYLEDELEDVDKNKVLRILQSVKHVDVLNIGKIFLQVFSVCLVVRSLSPPLMNSKCLTLNVSDFDMGLPGIGGLLHNSPMLEKLTINFETFEPSPEDEEFDFGEKYWNSQENVLKCPASHLKTIEIFGLIKQDWKDQHKLILRVLKFLVKNSKSLEEIAIFRQRMTKNKSCSCRSGKDFELEDFDYLMSMQRCNPSVFVSVLCCKGHAIASQNGASQL